VYVLGGEMPKTKRKAVPRVTIRIAKSIVDEADRIVRESGLYFNRQQFVESAIREKVEKFAEDGEVANLRSERRSVAMSHESDDSFLFYIKETFLAHVAMNMAKGEAMTTDHLDLKQLEQNIRQHIKRRVEAEGKKISEEWLDELTEELLEYHKEILKGLSLMAPH